MHSAIISGLNWADISVDLWMQGFRRLGRLVTANNASISRPCILSRTHFVVGSRRGDLLNYAD
jgi:hypothetical protein